MIRAAGAAFAAALFLSPAAFAAESQVAESPSIVVRADASTMHTKLIEAAATLCKAARAQDPFDDFGSQEECIANSVAGAHPVGKPNQRTRWASASPYSFDW
jgi:hypothetical protein